MMFFNFIFITVVILVAVLSPLINSSYMFVRIVVSYFSIFAMLHIIHQ